jgi:hypothetical protein
MPHRPGTLAARGEFAVIDIKKADLQHGWSWTLDGLRTLKKDIGLWAGMGLIFMLIAIVLKLIPFIGLLLLVLITPMLLAGALQTADALTDGTLASSPARHSGLSPQGIMASLQRAAGRLFITFSDEERLLPLMVISTLTLGMVVAINILAVLLKIDGSALTAMAAGSVGPRVWVPALIGWFLVRFLQLGLIMAVLYTVPLILFRREMPLVSIEKSFALCKQNFVAVCAFCLPFLLVYMLINVMFFALSFPLDDLAVLLLGWMAVPIFATGLYRSYQDLFKH